MDTHKNAPMTPTGRLRLVREVLSGRQVKEVAAAFQVDRKTVRKWVERFRELGAPGLEDRSSRPHRSPARIAKAKSQRVIVLRRRRWTMERIARELGVTAPGDGWIVFPDKAALPGNEWFYLAEPVTKL